jgi:hypothetical protein
MDPVTLEQRLGLGKLEAFGLNTFDQETNQVPGMRSFLGLRIVGCRAAIVGKTDTDTFQGSCHWTPGMDEQAKALHRIDASKHQRLM